MTRALFAAPALLLAAAAPAPAPDALTARLLAGASAVGETSFAFDRTTEINDRGTPHSRVEHYDPARPAPARWTLTRIDGHAPAPDEAAKAQRDAAAQPVPNYGRLAILLAAPATRTRDAAGNPVLHYDHIPAAMLGSQGHFLADHLSADLTVADAATVPWISRMKVYAAQPFRVMLIAKFDRFSIENAYQRLPDGRARLFAQVLDFSGSGPGVNGTVTTRIGYTYP